MLRAAPYGISAYRGMGSYRGAAAILELLNLTPLTKTPESTFTLLLPERRVI